MSVARKVKRKRASEKVVRKERRFFPEPTYSSRMTTLAGMAGSLVLGAGVYGEWIRDQPHAYSPYLVAVGALLVGSALWKGSSEVGRIRVGEAGIALERGPELIRILWCDLTKVSIKDGVVTAAGDQTTISFPRDAHPRATTWLFTEAGRRVPDVVKATRKELDSLGEPKDLDGQLVTIEELQLAGRHCKASDKPISFERDARLCPRCCQTYLKDQVPRTCLTCQADLGDRARAP